MVSKKSLAPLKILNITKFRLLKRDALYALIYVANEFSYFKFINNELNVVPVPLTASLRMMGQFNQCS
jgi:hypothetical protein